MWPQAAHTGDFPRTAYVDDSDRPVDPRLDKRAGTLSAVAGAASGQATVGFSFLGGNAAISSGNLFFSRTLFERIGPFVSLRYNHDWEFALRAVRAAEPKFVLHRPITTGCTTAIRSAARSATVE